MSHDRERAGTEAMERLSGRAAIGCCHTISRAIPSSFPRESLHVTRQDLKALHDKTPPELPALLALGDFASIARMRTYFTCLASTL